MLWHIYTNAFVYQWDEMETLILYIIWFGDTLLIAMHSEYFTMTSYEFPCFDNSQLFWKDPMALKSLFYCVRQLDTPIWYD